MRPADFLEAARVPKAIQPQKGAWAFPRTVARLSRYPLLGAPRHRRPRIAA